MVSSFIVWNRFGDLCVCVRTIVWSEESLIHNISSMRIHLSWIPRYSVDLWAESCPLVSKQQPTHHKREPDIDAVASHTSCPPDPVHTQYITLPCSSGKGDLLRAEAEMARILYWILDMLVSEFVSTHCGSHLERWSV